MTLLISNMNAKFENIISSCYMASLFQHSSTYFFKTAVEHFLEKHYMPFYCSLISISMMSLDHRLLEAVDSITMLQKTRC